MAQPRSKRANACAVVSVSVLLTALAALGSLPALAEWNGRTETRDGISHVLNPAQAAQAPRTVTLAEQWRIGGETDDPDEFFGVIIQIVVGPEAELYLLDTQLAEVKVFSPDGEYLRTIGREGEGPGEFRRPADLFLTPSGEVAVLQRFPGRIVLLTPEGDPAGDFPLPTAEDGGFRGFMGARRSGDGIVLYGFDRRFSEGSIEFTNTLLRVDTAGRTKATYFAMSNERNMANTVIDEKETGGLGVQWEVGPSGRVYSSLSFDDYRIDVWDATGAPLHVIERAYTTVARTKAQIESIRARSRPRGRRGGQMEYRASETHRSVLRMFPREDGSLWVLSGRGGFESPGGTLGVFDVFDAEGRFQEQVTLVGEGDYEKDGFFFVGDRLYVVTGLQESLLAMRGGTSGEDAAYDEDEEEPQPVAVVCYRLEG